MGDLGPRDEVGAVARDRPQEVHLQVHAGDRGARGSRAQHRGHERRVSEHRDRPALEPARRAVQPLARRHPHRCGAVADGGRLDPGEQVDRRRRKLTADVALEQLAARKLVPDLLPDDGVGGWWAQVGVRQVVLGRGLVLDRPGGLGKVLDGWQDREARCAMGDQRVPARVDHEHLRDADGPPDVNGLPVRRKRRTRPGGAQERERELGRGVGRRRRQPGLDRDAERDVGEDRERPAADYPGVVEEPL
jgi:hypothetical protein